MPQTPSPEELQARLSLWRASGIGPVNMLRLLEHFGSIQSCLNASEAELQHSGLAANIINAIKGTDVQQAEMDINWLNQFEQRHILTIDDPRYPPALRDIKSAPPILFVAGNIEVLNDPLLAMVGSRNPTNGGKDNARAFAAHLAGNGLGIVSGLALGIDSASHHGALEGQGTTIAVIGTGLDIIYPARNKSLAANIVEQGGVIISEFPIGTKPQAQNFPRRNRIISGLSLGTLVVEATLRSGSLLTAKHAMEQGREVLAIPGSIHNPMARGCHQLIRQGAKLVETAQDILEEIAPQLQSFLHSETPDSASIQSKKKKGKDTSPPPKPTSEPADPEHQLILAALGHDPVPIDQIILNTGLTTDAVSSILLLLELQGLVSACGGSYYMRTAS